MVNGYPALLVMPKMQSVISVTASDPDRLATMISEHAQKAQMRVVAITAYAIGTGDYARHFAIVVLEPWDQK